MTDETAELSAELCAEEYSEENDDDADGSELIELWRLDSEPDPDTETDWLIDIETDGLLIAETSDDDELDDEEEKIDDDDTLDTADDEYAEL